MAGPNRHSLVAVLCGKSTGSGYLVGRTLVLTAGHVVVEPLKAGAPAEVVFPEWGAGAPAHLTATMVWHDGALDACLLRITDPAWTAGAAGGAPARTSPLRWWWGIVTGAGPVAVRSLGFPKVARREGRLITYPATGVLQTGTGGKGPNVYVRVTSGTPADTPAGSPWSGMSGAAVFAGPYLVAMLVKDPMGWQNDMLDALKIDRLLDAPGFQDACANEDVPGSERVIATASGVAIPDAPSPFERGLTKELRELNEDSTYRNVAKILEFGDDIVPDADSTPIFAREIVANAGSVVDRVVKEAVRPVSPELAAAIYEWVAPWGWIPTDASRQLREKVEAPDRPAVVAVSARRPTTVRALLRHAGGEFRMLPVGWQYVTFLPPEGEQRPGDIVVEITKAVGDELAELLGERSHYDDDEEWAEAFERLSRSVVLVVPTLATEDRARIAAELPGPVLVFRCKPGASVGDQPPGVVVLDLGLDSEVEMTYFQTCAALKPRAS